MVHPQEALLAQLPQLANQLTALQNSVTMLQNDNNNLTTRISTLETDNTTLTTANTNLQTQLTALPGGGAAGGAAAGGAGGAVAVFSTTPAMVNHQNIIDYTTKVGTLIYDEGIRKTAQVGRDRDHVGPRKGSLCRRLGLGVSHINVETPIPAYNRIFVRSV